ncbi:CHAT domain-containing protein [uncultured Aquimarina sp.]|uniref:CHAT domain-containing protein n=1 Tax=uncultured Aquimarina sp. TaxID=575652 RepID=UPI00263500D2|nr:CHAT domain-containing protein [uncultured Aquimarina sp.]
MKPLHKHIVAYIFCVLGLTLYSQGISPQLDSIHQLTGTDYDNIHLYNELLNTWEEEKNYTQLGSDAHQIAKWLHKNDGTKQEAIKILKKAIDARIKALPFNPNLLRSSYNNLGLYHLRTKKYLAAINAYKKLIAVDGSKFLNGRAYLRIADCYALLGDPFNAIDNNNKAFLHLKNKKYIIFNHINIADSFKSLRNKKYASKSIEHLKKAESLIFSSSISKKSLFKIYNNLGGLYFETLHDTIVGEKYFLKALDIAKDQNSNEYISKTSYNLGLLNIRKNKNSSLEYFDQSLQYSKGDLSIKKSIYYGLGLLENSLTNYQDATDFYYKSLSAFFNTSLTDQNLENILNRKELSVINDKMLLLEILKDITSNYINLGDHKKELQFYKEAIKLTKISDLLIDIMIEDNISNNSKLLWRSIASGTYAAGVEACNKINETSYGFYLSEKHKALLLMLEIDKDVSQIPESVLAKEVDLKNSVIELQQLYNSNITQKNIDSISNLLFDKKERLSTFTDSLSTIYPNYFSSRNLPKIVPLSEITYDTDKIIIQYMMTERISGLFPNTYCLVLSKNDKKLYQLENTKQLHDKIYDLRKRLDVPFRSKEDILSYQEKSYDLYTSLIPKEVRSTLKNKKVTIIPDHLINTIPFEALVTDIDSGRYLLEDCEISYTYSLSFEKQNKSRIRNAQKEFLGIAPVDFPYELTSLRQSKKEISTANTYYSGSLLLDGEATKENFIQEASDYKIIHLATHANASDSIAPWIAFRNQKMIDKELDLLKNQADLVVLSACNTSLGIVNSGEGVLSLARGFFKSGAKSVIPSLWSTNDKATATITSDFYKNLSEGQTKSAALRTAKLNYLHNNTDAEASPHYWASLVLIGDSGTLLPQSNNLLFLWVGLGLVLVLIILYILFLRKKKK